MTTHVLDLRPRAVGHHLRHQLRRSQLLRSLVTVGVIEPMFFLLIMGFGVGSFVDRNGTSALDGVDYLAFIGPGLLATTAMQFGAREGLWPTAGAIKWEGGYRAALNTPLTIDELVTGHIAWIGARILAASVLFTGVLTVFSVPASWWALAAPLAAALVAMSFGAPTSAYAAFSDGADAIFPLILRIGIVPMFIFSGAFFPLDTLPTAVAWLTRLTPAWHGVELCRDLVLGTVSISDLGHVAYLLALAVLGWQWARRGFRKALSA